MKVSAFADLFFCLLLLSACSYSGEVDLSNKDTTELADLLKDPDQRIVKAAATELSTRGSAVIPVIPNLNDALDNPDPYIQIMVLLTLGNAGDQPETDISKIRSLLYDPSPDVAAAAANTLGKINDFESIGELQKITIKEKDYRIRIETIKSIISLGGSSQSVPIFIYVLENDSNQTVRKNAIEGLGEAESSAICAIPSLIENLDRNDMWFRAVSAEAIARISGNDELIDYRITDFGDGEEVQVVINIKNWWGRSGQHFNYPDCELLNDVLP